VANLNPNPNPNPNPYPNPNPNPKPYPNPNPGGGDLSAAVADMGIFDAISPAEIAHLAPQIGAPPLRI